VKLEETKQRLSAVRQECKKYAHEVNLLQSEINEVKIRLRTRQSQYTEQIDINTRLIKEIKIIKYVVSLEFMDVFVRWLAAKGYSI
jgi:chromosome segregation ATPase